jgi:FAD/FMN-containing dehydrogenase
MGEISRRELLGGTGAVLAAGIAARPRPALRPLRSRPDWAALAGQLRGPLLRPGDRGYAVASSPYNKRYADIRPGGVALCAGVADVRAALAWARRYAVPFAVRSGGHSYGGYCTTRGLVISLARMNSVRVDRDARTITLGPGALNRDLYAALAGTGLAAPSGRCPTVAISGLLLGGGFGFSSRHLGLTCDQLLHTDVVTASGVVLRASPRSHQDLMWACQGGGGGNFGVNTSYTLQAIPVGAVSVYRLGWPWRQASAALSAVLGLMAAAPDTLSCRIGLEVSATRRGVSAIGLYFGPARELAGLLAPVFAAVWPTEQQIEDRSYAGAQQFLAHSAPAGAFASKSRYLLAPLADAGIETAIRWLERWPGSTNPGGAGMTIFAWGGAIGRVDPAATAFVHRDAAFLLDTETSWTARDSPRAVAAGLDWVEGFYRALGPYATRQAYQNFIDPSLAGWQTAYYGTNLRRLIEVKRRYDPDDVFRFPQSIPERALSVLARPGEHR